MLAPAAAETSASCLTFRKLKRCSNGSHNLPQASRLLDAVPRSKVDEFAQYLPIHYNCQDGKHMRSMIRESSATPNTRTRSTTMAAFLIYAGRPTNPSVSLLHASCHATKLEPLPDNEDAFLNLDLSITDLVAARVFLEVQSSSGVPCRAWEAPPLGV